MSTKPAQGHGWWPYLAPYGAFLMLVEIGRRAPESAELAMLILKPAIPALMILAWWRSGAYPELRGFRWNGGAVADVGVGVASAMLWMAPYVLFPGFRELLGVDASGGFDPAMLGDSAGAAALALGLRLFGYALVTPFFEELFIRSFVMRYADVYPGPGDFRDLPIARYTRRSFVATVVIFTLGHVPSEWPVAIAWIALTNLWFYRRRHIGSVILLHGAANATILAAAWLFGFWYFV